MHAIMKEAILQNVNNPAVLEDLYRSDKLTFKKEFNLLYPEISGNNLAVFWHERLNYENQVQSWGVKNELVYVVIAALIAGVIAKLPYFFNMDEEFFYPRNIGFIVFPILSAYFAWKNKLHSRHVVFISVAFLACAVFINSLPNNIHSDTLMLSCIHLAFFLWTLTGFSFTGNEWDVPQKRIAYLQFNGDLVIMSALILIAGGIMTGITIGLFSLIGYDIARFYAEWIGVMGLAATPIVATFLTQTNPQLVNKVSPVIAKIFSPLVLVTLVVYLLAMMNSGKDPYNDRDFLMTFNALLVGVMALILFSVVGTSMKTGRNFNSVILLSLSLVTVIVNGIAVSAILFRIAEWGITPNRLAVLGGNLLILINLILVAYHLFGSVTKRKSVEMVENTIARFLPIYSFWALFVAIAFPLIFNFK